ncbi:hypothetical protein BT69DRAFT_1379926 [Atractiella rhizophila]|nr:hypothetical protein BT69DRAFT_1379926 [Atractiella rhizophila]
MKVTNSLLFSAACLFLQASSKALQADFFSDSECAVSTGVSFFGSTNLHLNRCTTLPEADITNSVRVQRGAIAPNGAAFKVRLYASVDACGGEDFFPPSDDFLYDLDVDSTCFPIEGLSFSSETYISIRGLADGKPFKLYPTPNFAPPNEDPFSNIRPGFPFQGPKIVHHHGTKNNQTTIKSQNENQVDIEIESDEEPQSETGTLFLTRSTETKTKHKAQIGRDEMSTELT